MTNKTWKISQNTEKQFWDEYVHLIEDMERNIIRARDFWRPLLFPVKHYMRGFRNGMNTDSLRILDVGCGPYGMLFFVGEEEQIERVSVDPLNPFYMRKYIHFKHRNDVSYFQSVGESLPFKEGSFHIVFCNNSLDHSIYPDKVLMEIRRVLIEGGLLFMTCETHTPLKTITKKIIPMIPVSFIQDVAHPHYFILNQLYKLCLKSKYNVLDIMFRTNKRKRGRIYRILWGSISTFIVCKKPDQEYRLSLENER